MINKIHTAEEAKKIIGNHRQNGKKIVFTNGCFDLLHAGHVLYLEEARALGDILVIGLNTDASVQQNKGTERPIVPQKERGIVLSGLSCVDMIVYFDDLTPMGLIDHLRPDIHVKGGDYKKETLPEYSLIISYGGTVESLPFYPGFSSTTMIEKILRVYGK